MTFLSMTDEKDAWWELCLPGIFFFFPPVKVLLYETANSLHRLPINFYLAMLVIFAKWRLASLYEINLRLRLSWSFSYNEAFCLRMDLVCSIAIVVGCSCLPSSINRSSLRSRFSFCLSWSICSCDHPPCGKVYCLLVYHCL